MSLTRFLNRSERSDRLLVEHQYFNLLSGIFVATLLVSNTIAAKPWQIGRFIFPGGALLFPISYIFGDVLTEVYGFARARQVIWTGFIANAIMVVSYWAAIALPPAQFWQNQDAFSTTLGQVPRIAVASVLGYLAGEFVNSFVLAKMKIRTRGRHLWVRIIGSTAVGQAVDTFLFVIVAFFHVWPFKAVWVAGASLYGFKVLYEVVASPLTYSIVGILKRKEGADCYDIETNFSPFRWEY